jgi:hypothetical protein
MYVCDTSSHILRVFENKVLRRVFRPKRNYIWLEAFCNEELHGLYCRLTLLGWLKYMMRCVARTIWETHTTFWLKITRKRPLWRPICEYMDNIKISCRPVRSEDVDELELAENRVQIWASINSVMNFEVLYKQKFLNQLIKILYHEADNISTISS